MAIGIFVHDLGSREIRVRFDAPVSGAEDFIYLIASSTGYVPTIVDVSYYDANETSVKITLNAALTRGETYTCQVTGSSVTDTPFSFLATDEDQPIILGAYQSKRGNIDIICDRPVGAFSTAATASLALVGGGSPASMTHVPWSTSQSPNSVRFSFSSAPAGSAYIVQYSDIKDVSGNACKTPILLPSPHGEVPLELAYDLPGYTYADLVQAQVTHAFVADVSNAELFATAVLRVFFSCPMLASDVTNASNWTIYLNGAHVAADIVLVPPFRNAVTIADATDDPSFILLVNEIKARLNDHLISQAHIVTDFSGQITTIDAVDAGTARSLMSEISSVLTAHYERVDMHLYADHLHPLGSLPPYALANNIKAMYNEHLAGQYQLSLSSAYSPLGPIVNFASSSNASFVMDQFTWFADLHVSTDAFQASVQVDFSGIRSEDLASTAAGTISIDPATSLPNVMSVTRFFRGATVRMSCDTSIQDVDAVFLRDGAVPIKNLSTSASSLPVLWWAFNNALHAYRMHINDPAVSPYLGAQHKILDTVNTVGTSDYASTMQLSSLITKVNAFKAKLGAHMTSETFHFGQDAAIDTMDATDALSLGNLIADLRVHLTRHNMFGFEVNSRFGTVPLAPMYHTFPGAGIVSAIMRDLIVVALDGAVDGNTLMLEVPIKKVWKDNRPNVVDRTIFGMVGESFEAVDSPPVLTSAVARPGFSSVSQGLLSDAVELYLSKPMRNRSLTVGTNIIVTGAPMSMVDAGWLNDRTIFLQVASMSSASYSVEASGLQDIAGNLIG